MRRIKQRFLLRGLTDTYFCEHYSLPHHWLMQLTVGYCFAALFLLTTKERAAWRFTDVSIS